MLRVGNCVFPVPYDPNDRFHVYNRTTKQYIFGDGAAFLLLYMRKTGHPLEKLNRWCEPSRWEILRP